MVRLGLPRHRVARRSAHGSGVVLVLYAAALPEGVVEVGGYVSCRVDIRVARAQVFIYHDTVPHLQPRLARKRGVRLNTEARHHAIRGKLTSTLRFQPERAAI